MSAARKSSFVSTAVASPRRLVVEPDSRVRYRRAFRGPKWADVSARLRVLALVGEVCGWRPVAIAQLQCAHLVSEFELFLLGLRDRYLLDERNLGVLCRPCHRAFDLWLGVLDERRMAPAQATRLRRRFEGFTVAFRRLALRRIRFLAAALAETDGGAR